MTIFLWLLGGIVSIILLVTVAETLGWWYLWHNHLKLSPISQGSWKNAIVFLTGISDYAGQSLATEQIEFLQEIGKNFRVDIIIAEPFPYQRFIPETFAKFDIWRHWGFKELPLWLISLHNFWQTVLVTGLEKTYGNGTAVAIMNKLGFPTSPESTLCLICGSTGAGIALAAAPKLKEQLQVSLIIISYGGFFGASDGFDFIEKFYDLKGKKDVWSQLGKIIFPGRSLPVGALARAKKDNRFVVQYTGNHKHLEYLSDHPSETQAETYRQLTLQAIADLAVWQEKGLKD